MDFTDAQFDLFVVAAADYFHLYGPGDGAEGSRIPALPTFKHTTFGPSGANFTNAKLGFCVRVSPSFDARRCMVPPVSGQIVVSVPSRSHAVKPLIAILIVDFCLDGTSDCQDIEATDLQRSDFDKADCSYTDLDGAHMQDAINANNARFSPPAPDVAGWWSIDVDAETSAGIHVHTNGRAIVGKATFVVRKREASVDAVVSGRLDLIDTAEAREILRKQSDGFISKTNDPVQRGLGMPVARFRMEFLAESDNANALLKLSGFDSDVSTRTMLAYEGAVWLVDADAANDKKKYSLRGFVPHPPPLPLPGSINYHLAVPLIAYS